MARIQSIVDKIGTMGRLIPLKTALLDFISGAPARSLVLAYNGDDKIVGALTYIDSKKDEQEIKALGIVTGEVSPRSLVRALDHRKTLAVSANNAEHSLYEELGFYHSEELEEGSPSLMLKLPPGVKMASSDLLGRALAFASKAHESVINADGSIGQKRKYTGQPYIVHPSAVADILKKHAHEDNVVAAAYLHDVVEDTPVGLAEIEAEFGPEIADLVRQVTQVSKAEDGNRKLRKALDRDHYSMGTPGGQSIKLADIIHNIQDIVPYDTGFGRKWVEEAEDLVRVLTKGDAELHSIATRLIEEAKIVLEKPKTKTSRSNTMFRNAYTKVASELAICYCVNPECDDFEKRDHGNLTQEFAYGVDNDRHMLYCATCQSRFSETRCTEFFGAKISSKDISNILEKTVDGMSIRETADALDLNKDTVNQVLIKARKICEEYIEEGKKKVNHEMLNDIYLTKKHKQGLQDFISEVVIPGVQKGEDDSEEE